MYFITHQEQGDSEKGDCRYISKRRIDNNSRDNRRDLDSNV